MSTDSPNHPQNLPWDDLADVVNNLEQVLFARAAAGEALPAQDVAALKGAGWSLEQVQALALGRVVLQRSHLLVVVCLRLAGQFKVLNAARAMVAVQELVMWASEQHAQAGLVLAPGEDVERHTYLEEMRQLGEVARSVLATAEADAAAAAAKAH